MKNKKKKKTYLENVKKKKNFFFTQFTDRFGVVVKDLLTYAKIAVINHHHEPVPVLIFTLYAVHIKI